MTTVLLTGAHGFVGHSLAQALQRRGHRVVAATVRLDTGTESEWSAELNDCEAVIHLAARVHVTKDRSADPLTAFRKINTSGSLRLARQAAIQGVRRFVFVSSIKVNGEETAPAKPFRHNDPAGPLDPYGESKREAEEGLREICASSSMEPVIVRPPLVYGPGVKANFAALMRTVQRGVPLPFGAVTENRRSFVALDNLVDLLTTCLEHAAAADQTFLVSDDEDLSTAELLRRIGLAVGVPARLLPVSPALLKASAILLGRRAMAQRLLGHLQVDISHTRQVLGWTPPISVDVGLLRAAEGLRTV